jgi:hypothetical protein
MKGRLRHNIDGPTQHLFQLIDQSCPVKERSLGTRVDKQIYVALWASLVTANGPEYAHVGVPKFRRRIYDGGTMGPQHFLDSQALSVGDAS